MCLEIIPLKYAESVLSDALIFQGGKENIYHRIPFIMYLIKTEDRKILVDAGCKTMPGFDMKNFIGPVEALRKFELSTQDITDVIITHSHHDHIECISLYKNAIIHIQKSEYEQGMKYIPDNMAVNVFDNEFVLEDTIKVVKIGGHTPGSCVVEITTDDKTVVIVGDECYSRKCITEKVPTGSSSCVEKSEEFIKKYSDARYELLYCHDE